MNLPITSEPAAVRRDWSRPATKFRKKIKLVCKLTHTHKQTKNKMATYPRRNKANSVVRLLTRIRRARSDALSSSN